MLKQSKLFCLQASERLGVSHLVLNSRWRQERLLILCYHGTALEDEHEWNGSLYMHPDLLRQRMQAVRDNCTVLPLDEAVRRLYDGDLPKRAVAITFDDGTYDFYRSAWPILSEFGFPVTVYWTTYYAEFNRPVFDVMLSYLLWKARGGNPLQWRRVLADGPLLLDENGRRKATREVMEFANQQKLSGRDKDALLAELAGLLGIDYDALCRKRLLHIMTPGEASDLAKQGVDLQLHTHRHRVWRRREKFFSELDDNKRRIEGVGAPEPRHFCYTGGFKLPEFTEYLEQYGVSSATTCEVGLCSRASHRMHLPRLVDTTTLSAVEFRSWISGIADVLPKRPYVMESGQLAEEA